MIGVPKIAGLTPAVLGFALSLVAPLFLLLPPAPARAQDERQELAPDQVAAWRTRLAAAIAAVDAAWSTSVLPPDPPPEAIAAIDDWLRGVRKQFW